MRYAYNLFKFWLNFGTAAVLYRWNIPYPHSFSLSQPIWLLRCFFFKVLIIKIDLMKMLTQIINLNWIYLFIISWYNFNIWLNVLRVWGHYIQTIVKLRERIRERVGKSRSGKLKKILTELHNGKDNWFLFSIRLEWIIYRHKIGAWLFG